jgi:dipeptidyl aminopeptidase/acylaminoacyl peptidase
MYEPLAAQRRPLTPEDLFRMEEVGDVAISPDGRGIAYVRRRPIAGHKEFQQGFMGGNDRADIWLAEPGGAAPRKLTDGAPDSSGYWMPTWSPDGARLAMLSTKGGTVRLWVWQRANGRLEPWSTRPVNMSASPAFAWIDNTRIAAVLLPEGQNPAQMTVERRAGTVAMREWPKTWAGTETTVSVLDSGVPAKLDTRSTQQLAILSGGSAQVLTSAYSLRDLRLSPDRSQLAVLSQVAMMRPDPARLLQHGAANRFMSEDRYEVRFADAAGKPSTRSASKIHAIPATLQWSADNRSLAFVGASAGTDAFSVFRADLTGAAQAVSVPDVDPRSVVWMRGGALLVSGERKLVEQGKERTRSDWWLTQQEQAPRNLTETLKSAPSDLIPEPGAATFVGLADGDLWRVDPAGTAPVNLTASFEPKIASIVWPSANVPRTQGFERLIVGVQSGPVLDLHRVELKAGGVTAFARPSRMATLSAYRPDMDLAVFTANEPTGTFLTAEQRGARHSLVTTNEFLREIGEGEVSQIEYRSLEGQDLKAWVLYPPGYNKGTRYPVVAWVYAGSLARETPTVLAQVNTSHPLNLQLLAARGYVVLMPSMPLAPEREPSDPYMDLPKGVLPALDKLIELGVADPKRLAVMGQSYGGYSTYGLITQTNRFKAAVSLAGLNDLISLYGIFDMRSRYEPNSHERLFSQSIAESGQIRMGNPPWKDAGRYLRNSPLFYVDRVQTPLLIVQGDMDYVALQQGEQFFTALYRQGKRARFARYWGEGHVFSSPANIRDLWKQIYAWFDEFLAAPVPSTRTQ